MQTYDVSIITIATKAHLLICTHKSGKRKSQHAYIWYPVKEFATGAAPCILSSVIPVGSHRVSISALIMQADTWDAISPLTISLNHPNPIVQWQQAAHDPGEPLQWHLTWLPQLTLDKTKNWYINYNAILWSKRVIGWIGAFEIWVGINLILWKEWLGQEYMCTHFLQIDTLMNYTPVFMYPLFPYLGRGDADVIFMFNSFVMIILAKSYWSSNYGGAKKDY